MARTRDPIEAEVLALELFDRLAICGDFLRRDLTACASEANLTSTELLALRELALARRPICPSDLAFLMRCSKAHVTKTTDRLVAAGYIEKNRIPLTAHGKSLMLTSAGREALTRAITSVELRTSLAPLTKREVKQLHSLLGRLQQTLEDVPSHPAGRQ